MIRSAALRARYLIAQYGGLIATACVVVGLVSLGGAGWLFAHPPTTETTDHTHRQTIQSNVATEAVVAENATLYDPGRTLTNRSVYLRSEAPVAMIVGTTTVPEGQPVTVSQRLVATYSAGRDGTTFWRDSTTLGRTETTTRSGRVRTRVRFDPAAVRNRTAELGAAIGNAGSVDLRLRFEVSYETPRYAGTLAKTFSARVGDGWYGIDTPSVSRTHTTPVTSTTTVPTRQRGLRTGLGGLGVGGLLAGVAALVAWRVESRRTRTGDLTLELHRRRYADWISTGTVPEDAGETTIGVASLEDLVDVGIDTGNRVIHDPSRDRYVIVDGSTLYYFDPFWSE
ncbi:MAG: DUF5305 family protein [Haloferacaceae archaeon]